MRRFPPTWRPAGLLILILALVPAVTFAGEARVNFREGVVTATFDAVAVPEALELIRRATGVEIVVLRSIQQPTLTLSVDQVPFERFIHDVLGALELGGFALV